TSPEGASSPSYFCSQRCLEASHRDRSDGQVSCDACARRFTVELAAQVLFTGGRRHYACDAARRQRALEGMRAVRLGHLMDPNYPINEPAPSAAADDIGFEAITPSPPPSLEMTPSPAPSRTQPSGGAQAVSLRPNPAQATPERRRNDPRVLAVFNHK